mmetsp:Transcript_23550/g.36324  ORF Transcript_23550/g.36324 Transcript_23550/m.36324 type:complete len:113 (+) Transcript_23550:81-419(+)
MTALTEFLIERRRMKEATKRRHERVEKDEEESPFLASIRHRTNLNEMRRQRQDGNRKRKAPMNTVDISIRAVFFMWVGSFLLVGVFVWYLTRIPDDVDGGLDNEFEFDEQQQ